MSDDIMRCPKCNFKCVKSQLYKSYGVCPNCIGKGDPQPHKWKNIEAETGVKPI